VVTVITETFVLCLVCVFKVHFCRYPIFVAVFWVLESSCIGDDLLPNAASLSPLITCMFAARYHLLVVCVGWLGSKTADWSLCAVKHCFFFSNRCGGCVLSLVFSSFLGRATFFERLYQLSVVAFGSVRSHGVFALLGGSGGIDAVVGDAGKAASVVFSARQCVVGCSWCCVALWKRIVADSFGQKACCGLCL
jgi:hypothetical protein